MSDTFAHEQSHAPRIGGGRRENRPRAENQSGRILMKMLARPDWTVDEVTAVTGFDAHQRFADLERGNYIENTGATRPSVKQCSQTVYKLTDAGREWAMQHVGDLS